MSEPPKTETPVSSQLARKVASRAIAFLGHDKQFQLLLAVHTGREREVALQCVQAAVEAAVTGVLENV
jgi:hypothetical protein